MVTIRSINGFELVTKAGQRKTVKRRLRSNDSKRKFESFPHFIKTKEPQMN